MWKHFLMRKLWLDVGPLFAIHTKKLYIFRKTSPKNATNKSRLKETQLDLHSLEMCLAFEKKKTICRQTFCLNSNLEDKVLVGQYVSREQEANFKSQKN